MLYKKTIVGALAALTLVGGAAAQAQTSQPAAVTVGKAPVVAKAAIQPKTDHRRDEGREHKPCRYPGQVYTHTTISLKKYVQERGRYNAAFVTVYSQSGKPRGVVRVFMRALDGQGRDYVRYGKLYKSGKAYVSLPKWPAIGDYAVYARYYPNKCAKWKSSDSDTKTLTVEKRHHHKHKHHKRG
ncbi:MAG: hypothetical protein WBV37_00300 [Nocardioidaceae bacterium]